MGADRPAFGAAGRCDSPGRTTSTRSPVLVRSAIGPLAGATADRWGRRRGRYAGRRQVVFAIIVGAVTNRLFGPVTDEVWAFLRIHLALITFGLLGLAGLTLWSWMDKQRQKQQEKTRKLWIQKQREYQERSEEEQRLRQYFALFKPASELCPEDLGVQRCTFGESINPRYRPLYSTYVHRRAVAYDDLADQDGHDIVDEIHIAQELSRGRGFVLLGRPLDGKTRTLYEIVRQLAGYYVVRPTSCPTPPDAAFSPVAVGLSSFWRT
jgi:hypothetical protein